MYFKEEDSYIFTAENSDKPLEHGSFLFVINTFINQLSKKISNELNLSNYILE